jgi:hypothetical protein
MDDLQRTRLSRRRKIWFLPHPLPPPLSPVSKKKHDVRHMYMKTEKERQLADERGEGMGEEQNQMTARKPSPL